MVYYLVVFQYDADLDEEVERIHRFTNKDDIINFLSDLADARVTTTPPRRWN